MNLQDLGLNKKQANAFAKKNLYTAEDLVQYTPKQYRDYRTLTLIKEADPDRYGIFSGKLVFCDKRCAKKWYIVMRMQQDDGTTIGITLFSEAYRFNEYASMLHKRITVCGKPQFDQTYGWTIRYPEKIALEEEYVPHIEAIYTKIKGISDETFDQTIEKSIKLVKEPLDPRLVKELSLISYQDAISHLHRPRNEADIRTGRQRLHVNDMLYFAEALGKAQKHGSETSDITFPKRDLFERFKALLPYTLTEDQEKILRKFEASTAEGKRYNCLIQGDVGCGKTVVALSMAMFACGNGYQSVIMAPREVLAKQHFDEVSSYAEKLGIKCVFLSSSLTGKKKEEILSRIRTGEMQIIVGTHSCIADSVKYRRLGLTITDEEHLFGVRQKELLEIKADEGVHAVSMSATPIPRSLATILYGNKKEIMTIKSMPKGRLPIKTATQISHKNTFPFMEAQIKAGSQCYVVCPAIEMNEEYGITSIEEMEKEYRSWFKPRGIRMGVIHGKMDEKDVASTIDKFKNGDLDILMSTTVIEVGVNVPNATVMVVEQAERFGLASLHQLRGRVGRGAKQSYCILVSKERNNARLETMVRTTDGFEIAEADLKQRGSGDLLGVRQAGNNRFINEMQKNPLLFQWASDIVRMSREKGYENHLEMIYGDYAESTGEDA